MNLDIRADELAEYEILDTPPEEEFDDITRLATRICGAPIALISFLDRDRQWFKSKVGAYLPETLLSDAFCLHSVDAGSYIEVYDLEQDERFQNNVFVKGPPYLRFLSYTPLVTDQGNAIGALCAIDFQPRQLSNEQREGLSALGRQIMRLLELRRRSLQLAKSQARVVALNRELQRVIEDQSEAIQEREVRFRHLAENSSEVFWFVGYGPERVLYVSPAVQTVWGKSPDEFYANPNLWFEAVHPEDKPRIAEELRVAFATKQSHFGTAYRIFHRDGSTRWIAHRITPVRNEDGVLVRVGSIARDITDRKRTEHELNLSSERMRLAAIAGGVGIWDMDLLLGTLDWDDQMFELYGLVRGEAAPSFERWLDSVHPDDRQRARQVVEAAMKEDGKPLDIEFRIIRSKDGVIRYIRALAAVFRDPYGTPERMIGTNQDVTEDRQRVEKLNEALAQQTLLTHGAQSAERVKSEFLAVMSHEIRTPLNGILGFADLLAENANLPEDCRDFVEPIISSGNSLLRVLNDILDISRIEAGHLSIENTPYQPTELLSKLEMFMQPQAHAKGLELVRVISSDVPAEASGDSERIWQILLNLANNAVKLTAKGRITLTLGGCVLPDGGPGLEYAVCDTGPGIPEGKLKSIFERFTQLDSSNSRRYRGTGLGLTISRKLVELMGGSIQAENIPGGGARLSFRVPVGSVSPLSTSVLTVVESANVTPVLATRRLTTILIVDDDRINLRLLRKLLQQEGYDPLLAQNGVEALEIYRKERPECILMDVQMPEMDGVEAARRIRQYEQSEGLPAAFIAALTANVMPENERNCMAAGMDLYLSKPIKKDAILKALRSATSGKMLARSTVEAAKPVALVAKPK